MPAAESSLLSRVATQLMRPPSYAEAGLQGSILTVSATMYGATSADEDTPPTGFDPTAAALFEAVVESAYLVANADDEFDDAERSAFQHVVLAACGEAVPERQVVALVADLQDQLAEDGMNKRIDMVARTISKPEHAREVLRVAALIAAVSGGVSEEERDVMRRLCQRFGLETSDLEAALGEASKVLESD